MASAFHGRVFFDILGSEVNSAIQGNGVWHYPMKADITLTNGVVAGKVDLAWGALYSGVSASTTSIDLVGSLTDKNGAAVSFAEVVCIAIRNLSTTAANSLIIGPHATNGFGVVASNLGFWLAAIGSGGGTNVSADYDSASGDGGWAIFGCRTGVPATGGSTDILAILAGGATLNT